MVDKLMRYDTENKKKLPARVLDIILYNLLPFPSSFIFYSKIFKSGVIISGSHVNTS